MLKTIRNPRPPAAARKDPLDPRPHRPHRPRRPRLGLRLGRLDGVPAPGALGLPGSRTRAASRRAWLDGVPAPGVLGLACALAAWAALQPPEEAAAAQIRVGGHGVYQTGVLDGQFGAGGRAEVDLGFVVGGLAAFGTFDYFFPDCDGCSQWDASGLVGFVQGPFHASLGATYQRLGGAEVSEAARGWTAILVAGFRFDRLEVFVPFVEVRQELASRDQNQQTVSLGFLVGPSRARTAPRAPGR